MLFVVITNALYPKKLKSCILFIEEKNNSIALYINIISTICRTLLNVFDVFFLFSIDSMSYLILFFSPYQLFYNNILICLTNKITAII